MIEDIEVVKNELKQILSPERYKHSIGVMEKAGELAQIYSVNVNKAMLTAVAHDIAKEVGDEKSIEYARNNGIGIDSIELENPYLLHAPVGADMCKKRYNFTEEMCRAIAIHTTGDKDMSIFDKIIFLSDKIEKNRTYDMVEEIRNISLQNLDEAVLLFLNHHIERMIRKDRIIHPKSILCRNTLIKDKE